MGVDISLGSSYSLVDGSIDQITTTEIGSQASTIGDSSAPAVNGVLDIFCKAASEEFFQQLKKELGLKTRRGVYDLPLVIWLVTVQRGDGEGKVSTGGEAVGGARP